jgi:hypothetical protein
MARSAEAIDADDVAFFQICSFDGVINRRAGTE